MLENILLILEILGIGSVVAVMSLVLAFIGLPPELVIEAVVNKSPSFKSVSKLRTKNIGRIAAKSIKADVENVCAQMGGGLWKTLPLRMDEV